MQHRVEQNGPPLGEQVGQDLADENRLQWRLGHTRRDAGLLPSAGATKSIEWSFTVSMKPTCRSSCSVLGGRLWHARHVTETGNVLAVQHTANTVPSPQKMLTPFVSTSATGSQGPLSDREHFSPSASDLSISRSSPMKRFSQVAPAC